jgi:tRNA uridine 5-carboxymethylaminomethyl modification enzyme
VQLSLYRAIEGFENVEIMRDAYAIEYDCIDARMLKATLEHKEQKGLFFAGQLCGTSGYEEAAAQGLIAGINAALFLQGREQIVLSRSNSYIGVMIDDLVTKGTDEPYRMMTSRAEFRLSLRQDNADIRLTEIGREVGLVGDKQYRALKKKQREIARIESLLGEKLSFQDTNGYIDSGKIVLSEYLKRHDVDFAAASKLDILRPFSAAALLDVFVRLRYGGYLLREENLRKEHLRLEEMPLPADIDYKKIGGLRTEAAEKLTKIQPHSIGQAMRISGVNPADIDVLIISFARKQQ